MAMSELETNIADMWGQYVDSETACGRHVLWWRVVEMLNIKLMGNIEGP